jgi:hypothetical protein
MARTKPLQTAPPGWTVGSYVWLAFWLLTAALTFYSAMQATFWEFEAPPKGPVILLVTVLFYLVGGILYHRWKRPRRRAHAFARQADRLGLDFSYEVPDEVLKRCERFTLFQLGYEQFLSNAVGGERDGTRFLLMDHVYHIMLNFGIDGNQMAEEYRQTLMIFTTDTPVPDFVLTPKVGLLQSLKGNPFSRLEEADVTRNEHPAFKKAYRVTGDAKTLRRIFTPDVMDYFAANPGWCVEVNGGGMLLYKFGLLLKPENTETRLSKGREIRDLFVK